MAMTLTRKLPHAPCIIYRKFQPDCTWLRSPCQLANIFVVEQASLTPSFILHIQTWLHSLQMQIKQWNIH